MKYYVQFYRASDPTSKTEILGSDGVFILDGRNNLQTMITDAKRRIHQLKNIHDDIIAFTINRGERFSDSRIVYDSNPELKIESQIM
jgi:hypothetical protein